MKFAKIAQVTTRGVKSDWVNIPPGGKFRFKPIDGGGYLSSIWLTSSLGGMSRLGRLPTIFKKNGFKNLLFYDDVSFLNNVDLKITFDHHSSPDVNVPIASFYGCGFGKYIQHQSKYLGTNSGGFHSNFKMPYRKSCNIEVINNNHETISLFSEVTYTNCLIAQNKLLYFHAFYKSEDLKKGISYEIFQMNGSGQYMGCHLYMQGKSFIKNLLFLEGDLRMYIDQTSAPNLNYTGTEDYFLGGWYFVKGTFNTWYHGCTYKSILKRRVSAYRFHLSPPIKFSKKIKIEIDHGEENEIDAVYSSVNYWYQR